MPVKTRTRTRSTRSHRPRQSGSRRKGGRGAARRGGARGIPLQAWIGGGVFATIVLGIIFIGPVIAAAEAVMRTLGIGVILIGAGIAFNARLALLRPKVDRSAVRTWAGAHLLGLSLFGVAALFKPEWSVGEVAFADVSLGGNFGLLFTGSVYGVLAWAAVAGTGFSLVWPRRARQGLDALLAGAAYIASLQIPQKLWAAIAGFFTGLVPRAEEDSERLLEEPYVSKWDEEWQESPPEVETDDYVPTSTAIMEEPESDVLVTSTPGDEPEGRQESLPMGRPAGRGWELPPIAHLAEAADIEVRPVDNEARSKLIVDTLGSFGVDARVVSINQGPAVTQFGIEPGWEVKTKTVAVRDENGKPVHDKDGKPAMRTEVVSRTRVRVNKITNLANDLALALAAPTIRIEAPVPGKPIIGIEVPNTTTSLVSLRSVVESTAFQKVAARSNLGLGLGKGVSGEPVAADLARMPHLLIAGSTGSGKSVCINSIIACLLLHNTPEELRLVLVDPKRVELATFAEIPHLAFSKVITDPEEVVGTLQAVIHEMDSRYRRFAEMGVRNIETYNKSPKASHQLPYWVVIIDELADLMMAAPYEVERQICRLAQLARATGIHLIIATQRPSVDVVTGLIKANFPTRIAFAVSSQVDSRTIIDMAGADKLLGRGDMLFMATDAAKPKRIQGSFVSDAEIDHIVDWWVNDRFRHLVPDKLDHLLEEVKDEDSESDKPAADDDPLYEAAHELALQHSRISTSLLQRRLHIGYPRAARLIDLLEEEGVVGASESGQSRQVLVQEERDIEPTFGPEDDRFA